MKQFKLGGSSKLHGSKSLEGTSLCNGCSQKRKQEYKKFSLHVIGTSCCVLGSMQSRTNKCIRQSAEESSSIHKSYEGF